MKHRGKKSYNAMLMTAGIAAIAGVAAGYGHDMIPTVGKDGKPTMLGLDADGKGGWWKRAAVVAAGGAAVGMFLNETAGAAIVGAGAALGAVDYDAAHPKSPAGYDAGAIRVDALRDQVRLVAQAAASTDQAVRALAAASPAKEAGAFGTSTPWRPAFS